MHKLQKAVLIAFFAIGACDGAPGFATTGSLTERQFIAVMVELQLAAPAQRPALLKKYRTTEQEIRDYVGELSARPGQMSIIFDSIQAQVDRRRTRIP
jgi:hypothetical protein